MKYIFATGNFAFHAWMKNKVNGMKGTWAGGEQGVQFLKGFLCFLVYGKEEHDDTEMAGGKCSGGRRVGVNQDEWTEKTKQASEIHWAEFSWDGNMKQPVGKTVVAST